MRSTECGIGCSPIIARCASARPDDRGGESGRFSRILIVAEGTRRKIVAI
ncbi:hypothetical protein [Bradyrhizobium sp. SZCCHNR2011]|nr:hypothetical protein [Bradyrhizobium sp. SZCCHNR2011]